MISVIKVEREFGAGGTAMAEKFDSPPKSRGWLKSTRGSYERSLPVAGLAHFDADSMVAFMHRVIEGPRAKGNYVSCTSII